MIIEKIKSTIANKKLFKLKEPVLVCVSGGSDSVFLLKALNQLKDIYKLNISVAHLNHCLRGKESDADEMFVGKMAKSLGMPFFKARVDVARLAKKQKISIEQAARMARYNFFSNVCCVQKIKKVVLAHTKNDLAETVLMRILRGTGVKGLGAMRFSRDFEGLLLIRPLLETEKKEILKFLKKHKIKFRTDSSNSKKDYFRNKIRLDLIPKLIKLSPGLKENIVRLSENAQNSEDFLQLKLKSIYKKTVCAKKNEYCIQREKFLKLTVAMRFELIRMIIFNLKGDLDAIERRHIKIIDSFVFQPGIQGKLLDLPKNIKVNKTRKYIKFYIQKKAKKFLGQKEEVLLSLGEQLQIKSMGYSIKAQSVSQKVNVKRKLKGVEYLDLDKIKFTLLIRGRLAGDSFKPLGLKVEKKLKKFLIDEKIEYSNKKNLPLVLSGDEIVLVGDMRISEDYKVLKKTKRILKITIKNISNDLI